MAVKDNDAYGDWRNGVSIAHGDARLLDLRIFRALRRIIQAVDIHSRKLSSRHQITTPQLMTLLCVLDSGPVTPSDIARQVHLSDSTIVGILDRLESKNLVRRERSTTDRRRVYVSITEQGTALANAAPSPLQDELAEALRKLSELEQTNIALSLERVVDLMSARHLDAAPVLAPGEIPSETAESKDSEPQTQP